MTTAAAAASPVDFETDGDDTYAPKPRPARTAPPSRRDPVLQGRASADGSTGLSRSKQADPTWDISLA